MKAAESGALQRALREARFEVMPIKGAVEAASTLPAGTTVPVTCSPSRGIENTLDVAGALARRGLPAVPHLAARLLRDDAHVAETLRRLTEARFEEIFVIGGDSREPAGPFRGALDLLTALEGKSPTVRRIGIAGYPDGHPLLDGDTLLRALQAKAPHAQYIVTQVCFDAARIVEWVSSVRDMGIDLPVYIGLPGAVDTARLMKISLQIGVGESVRFLTKHSGLVKGLLQRTRYDPATLLDDLIPAMEWKELRVAGLHFNTFNQVRETVERLPLTPGPLWRRGEG